ncbi:Antiholin-like protein LrgA [Streptococcus canis]|uniref:Antiholin-like protein LrgA n=1 Tax=Streptococcus canis TaxID=1329 RepID=A0A3P5XRI2_STRCB|nr:antiholin-like murein hydrolase modulator LrgA [Streptococcus canis]MDV5973148.1 antiholin-like murein hydrolase modulator LrgA [Streptococcus canis]QKG76986.1 antiholin-like murein hydrolase modulator LrgA [Streptococcus canis]VDC43323.1 Antiholin-like protein LrgA [Streptococcus canis]
MTKNYSMIYQSVVIGTVVLISKVLETLSPIKLPASVIGLVLLFVALSTKIIALNQVEKVADLLVGNIGLFFVPAGISVINSLGILKEHFILNMLLIFISTLLLLVGTGWMTQLLMGADLKKPALSKPDLLTKGTFQDERHLVASNILAK